MPSSRHTAPSARGCETPRRTCSGSRSLTRPRRPPLRERATGPRPTVPSPRAGNRWAGSMSSSAPISTRRSAGLEQLTGSPVVRLNRAVAVAEAQGAEAGLAVLEGCEERLSDHHLLPATRAGLLRRLGRTGAAREHYRRALDLVGTDPERRGRPIRRKRPGTTGSWAPATTDRTILSLDRMAGPRTHDGTAPPDDLATRALPRLRPQVGGIPLRCHVPDA